MSNLIDNLCMHSVSKAVTASSYEVFTYNDNCIDAITRVIDGLLQIGSSEKTCSDLFYVCLLPGNGVLCLKEALENDDLSDTLDYEDEIAEDLAKAREEYNDLKKAYGESAINEYAGRWGLGLLKYPALLEFMFNYYRGTRAYVFSKQHNHAAAVDVASTFNAIIHEAGFTKSEWC